MSLTHRSAAHTMEDEHSLRKWLGHTDLTHYLKDKEVQVLLTSLKERITSLKEVRYASVCSAQCTSPCALCAT